MRRLVQAGPVEPCESCGDPVRVAQYEGGSPRLNNVKITGEQVRDVPGGHTPGWCQDVRSGRIKRTES
jgi:hypothetical protein